MVKSNNSVVNVKLKLSPELEKTLNHLEKISGKSKEFVFYEALIRYLEEADKLAKHYEQERTKGNKNHTTKDLLGHLNLKKVDWEK